MPSLSVNPSTHAPPLILPRHTNINSLFVFYSISFSSSHPAQITQFIYHTFPPSTSSPMIRHAAVWMVLLPVADIFKEKAAGRARDWVMKEGDVAVSKRCVVACDSRENMGKRGGGDGRRVNVLLFSFFFASKFAQIGHQSQMIPTRRGVQFRIQIGNSRSIGMENENSRVRASSKNRNPQQWDKEGA